MMDKEIINKDNRNAFLKQMPDWYAELMTTTSKRYRKIMKKQKRMERITHG